MNVQFTNLLAQVKSSKYTIPTVVGVVSFATGGGLGYILGKRNGDVFEVTLDEYMDELNEMIQGDALDSTEDIYPARTLFTPDYAIFDLEEYLLDEEAELILDEIELEDAIAEMEDADEPEEPEVHNIFAGNDADWNYEAELSIRTGDEPYVIHVDEFVADEMGYTQRTMTYYAGDGIMADEQKNPVYDYHNRMGELKFGHGSKDPNVVYIRNEANEVEYEVLLHQGSYSIEVEGMHIEDKYEAKELKHSVIKFRPE